MADNGGVNRFVTPLPGVPDVESPFFDRIFAQKELPADLMRIANDLRDKGFSVLDFPDPDFGRRADDIVKSLTPRFDFAAWRKDGWLAGESLRVQDAWNENKDIRAIAANAQILDILSSIYGRRAFPFQTLNFPVGTQQALHSDSVHFSSVPERFMCGVWVALEDIDESNGPLEYYPGSHRLPIYLNEHINACSTEQGAPDAHYPAYVQLWRELMEVHGFTRETFRPRRGQALIWAANLLHGGSKQINPMRTRWSQVTHYYFHGCTYYTPLMSDPAYGSVFYRDLVDIATGQRVPNMYASHPVKAEVMERAAPPFQLPRPAVDNSLPEGFDPQAYLAANPDVAAAKHDPVDHWREFGWKEGRRIR